MYNKMAEVYNGLMQHDMNYMARCDYIENILDYYDASADIVCDLACGTGVITNELARRGYDMIGVDISSEMLDIARAGAPKERVLYLNQDIKKLDLYGSCGAFLCLTDGFNYITSPKTLLGILKRIRTCFIDNGGLLIFDVSTDYKLSTILGNNTYVFDTDKIFYTWDNKFSKIAKLLKMDLTFFEKTSSKLYTRFDETHIQRAYSIDELNKLLKLAGFNVMANYADLTFDKPEQDTQRVFFVAKA